MRINIILHSSLRELLPKESKGRIHIELAEGTQIRSIMEMFLIPKSVICAVNDQIEFDRKKILKDGDILRFLRPSAGG